MTMSRKQRAALAVAVSILLIALGVVYCLQTNWFKEKVREDIVAVIERATGGRVEIKSFTYDWRTLTAHFQDFVVHGTELKSGPSLFRADSIVVRLRIPSLWKRQVDVAFLRIEHPHIYLLIRPDGSTNIPPPKVQASAGQIVGDLLNLKVRRFELHRGTVQVEAKRIGLDAHGENLRLAVGYDFAGPRYVFDASSRQLHINSDQFRSVQADVEAQGTMEVDRVVLRHLAFRSGDANIEASGAISDFTHPNADLQVTGQVAAAQLAGSANLPDLRGGRLMLDGRLRYDRSTSFVFNGKISGHDLTYRFRSVALAGGEFEADAAGTRQELRLTHVTASALGSRFEGAARIKDLREAQIDGRVSGISVHQIGRLYTNRPVPWTGTAAGPLHVQATIDHNAHDFAINSDLQIAPAAGGVPVSGNLSVSYREGGALELGRSHLDFPSTHLQIFGRPAGKLDITLDSTNLNEVQPIWSVVTLRSKAVALPFTLDSGSLHFEGIIAGLLREPQVSGILTLSRFRTYGQSWDNIRSGVTLSATELNLTSLEIQQGMLRAAGNASVGLTDWSMQEASPLRVKGDFRGADAVMLVHELLRVPVPVTRGMASGSVDIAGSLRAPQGSAQFTVDNLDAYGERIDQLRGTATLSGDLFQVTQARAQSNSSVLSFSGSYQHSGDSWRDGQARLKVDSKRFPFASLSALHKYEPALNGQLEIHAEARARIAGGLIEPTSVDGRIMFRDVTINRARYGDVALTGATHGHTVRTTFSGDLRGNQLNGTAEVQLASGIPVKGELRVNRMELETLFALLNTGRANALPLRGFVQGSMTFEGRLQEPARMHSIIRIEELRLNPLIAVQTSGPMKPSDLTFRNQNPIVLEASNGVITIHSLQILGKDTSLGLNGSVAYLGGREMDLRAEGSIDLRALGLFDKNFQSSGQSHVAALIRGSLNAPNVTGTLNVKNGAFSLNNAVTGVTDVNGTIKFERDRATIEKLTAQSGGGTLSLGGFVSFAGGSFVYRLEANSNDVRLRYADGIGVTANSNLRLTGTSKSSLLSGTIRISRITFNPSADIGGLLSRGITPIPASSNKGDLLAGLQLDVRVESTPELQLNTTLSEDVEAEIDLRVRGTPDRPMVLGTVSANQGDIKAFGTKYTINRGLVSFTNPIEIEPVLDLDLQTQARGITVDISVSGPLSKLNINYRSDPPLQPRDIVALLTVGRAPDIASTLASTRPANDVSALQAGANTVLGQAISPSSNRLSKLFGITSIKIDPLVQGITNTPQARLTVEQQMSRDVTITYITNLSQTSEQIFRFEWALSRQYSVIALRDDNGEFGIDIQYKKRFK